MAVHKMVGTMVLTTAVTTTADSVRGLVGDRGTEIVRKLRDEYYFVAVGSTPEQFRQYIAPQFDIWKNLVKEMGIKLEE